MLRRCQDDSPSNDASSVAAAPAWSRSKTGVLVNAGRGYARLPDGVSYADVDGVDQ